MDDLISRRAAVDALWKALYEYEDRTEKQFQESEDLDVAEWFQHRIFVQQMSDIDRHTLLELPSADAVPVVRCKYCKHSRTEELTVKSKVGFLETRIIRFCNKNEMPIAVRADMHFCAWGEMKDDENMR